MIGGEVSGRADVVGDGAVSGALTAWPPGSPVVDGGIVVVAAGGAGAFEEGCS
jgi:hypothetical protein